MTIRGIWAWINKSHFKNPHSEEINIYRHIWPSTDERAEVAVIWRSWIDLLFELRICILSFSGTGLGLTGFCWCIVISQALAQLSTPCHCRSWARSGDKQEGCSGGAGHFPSCCLASSDVCLCARMDDECKDENSCLNSFSCPMPREDKLPTLFILICC